MKMFFLLCCVFIISDCSNKDKKSGAENRHSAQYRVEKINESTYCFSDSIDILSYLSKPYGKKPHTYSLPVTFELISSLSPDICTLCTSNSKRKCVSLLNKGYCRLLSKCVVDNGKLITDTITGRFDSQGGIQFKSVYFLLEE